MARLTKAELKVKAFKDFRSAQARALSEYCRAHKICGRCRKPDKELVSDTLCAECSKYYKDYAASKREIAAIASKRKGSAVVKKTTPKPAPKARTGGVPKVVKKATTKKSTRTVKRKK